MTRIVCLSLFLASLAGAAADIAAVQAEPNLEKRSERALIEADKALGAARKAYNAGDNPEFKSNLDTVQSLAELSYKSLQDTGKKARKSPKWFKRAEQRLLILARKVDNFARDAAIEDRPAIEAVGKRIHQVHDQVLNDIMTKK